jgi:hypothetical protein
LPPTHSALVLRTLHTTHNSIAWCLLADAILSSVEPGAAQISLGRWCAVVAIAPRDRRRHCRPSHLRRCRKSARRGAGSVEPGTQVLEGPPAPQSAVAPQTTHRTHAVRHSAPRDSNCGPSLVTPCDSVARGLVLSHLSALAARETKTRQRSSRGHLLHHAGTAGAVAQAATRRVWSPDPLR